MNAYYHYQYKVYNICYFYILREIIFLERKVTGRILSLVTVCLVNNYIHQAVEEEEEEVYTATKY